MILNALNQDQLFFSATLPLKILPPLFNRYGDDCNFYGPHIDGSVLKVLHSGDWLRSDISCTVFLSDPNTYDGGELTIQDTNGSRGVKFAAGDAVIYPASSVHQVTPVTRGVRIPCLWIDVEIRCRLKRQGVVAGDGINSLNSEFDRVF